MPLPKDLNKTLVGKTDEVLFDILAPSVDYLLQKLKIIF